MIVRGNILDLHGRRIFKGEIRIEMGKIIAILEKDVEENHYILPGFVDSHIHVESSMMTPASFARQAVRFGTVATVSDPHEIANVLGMAGVEYMLHDAAQVPFKFHFGAPSCVPATSFETAGAVLDSSDVRALLERDDIWYLSEMMNYPGVLNSDSEVMAKIAAAHALGKPVDGHAPGLRGDDARIYANAGISTDHECFTLEEALDKLNFGMKILIREGSAARNYEALKSLINSHPDQVMLCSDDKHPDDLAIGHLDLLVKRALKDGLDLMNILRAACVNPVEHYKLPVGLLREGDAADLMVVDDLTSFKVLSTMINGEWVYANGEVKFPAIKSRIINAFNRNHCVVEDFKTLVEERYRNIIVALDKQIVTERKYAALPEFQDEFLVDLENDIIKMAVVNRYHNAPPAMAFIQYFGLKKGALASSVAHDSHNIIAVGVNDEMICKAVNTLIDTKGGVCYVDEDTVAVLSLPIAGLMSDLPPDEIGIAYAKIDKLAKQAGCTLSAPYMTMSFMALLVIPKLKLSDLGLFDAERFAFL